MPLRRSRPNVRAPRRLLSPRFSSALSKLFAPITKIREWLKGLRDARRQKQWRPFEITLFAMIFMLLVEVGIIAAITTLLIISSKKSGWINLGDPPHYVLGHPLLAQEIWGSGFFYTALPPFVMTCYNMSKDGIFAAVWDRQPYVELAKTNAVKPRVSIMLDYSKVKWWWRFIKAACNGHYVIAICALLSACNTFFTVPLTAYLFTDAHFDTNSTITGHVTETFDYLTFSQADLRPAFDTVNAVRLHGAEQTPWTYNEYAFPELSFPVTSGNITAASTSYSANLSCRQVPQNETEVQHNNGSLTVSVSNGECNATETAVLLSSGDPFVSTWAYFGCSEQKIPSQVIIFSGVWTFAAESASSFPANFSFISCETTYWNTSGSLSISLAPNVAPFISDFTPDNVGAARIDLPSWQDYEQKVQLIQSFDPSSSINANEFGRLVYELAKKQNPSSPLDAQTLQEAAVVVYADIFAAFARTAFFQTDSSPAPEQVTVTGSVHRLIVVPPVAYIILGLMAVAAALSFVLLFYTSSRSILLEEPVGLFGAAALLHGSNLEVIIQNAVPTGGQFDGLFAKAVSEKYDIENVNCSRTGVTPDDYRIEVTV